jgi:hypothetical protein
MSTAFLNIYCNNPGFLIYMVTMGQEGMYAKAHTFVAAIRVLEHLHQRPPVLHEIAALLAIAPDEASRISRRLEELKIVDVVKSGIEERFSVGDHLKIEDLPREESASAIQDEVNRLKAQKESKLQELQILMKKGPAKPELFNELDKALKDPSHRKKPNPLD